MQSLIRLFFHCFFSKKEKETCSWSFQLWLKFPRRDTHIIHISTNSSKTLFPLVRLKSLCCLKASTRSSPLRPAVTTDSCALRRLLTHGRASSPLLCCLHHDDVWFIGNWFIKGSNKQTFGINNDINLNICCELCDVIYAETGFVIFYVIEKFSCFWNRSFSFTLTLFRLPSKADLSRVLNEIY